MEKLNIISHRKLKDVEFAMVYVFETTVLVTPNLGFKKAQNMRYDT